jgi:hypothetical protein
MSDECMLWADKRAGTEQSKDPIYSSFLGKEEVREEEEGRVALSVLHP